MDLEVKPDLYVSKTEEEGFKELTPFEKQVMRWIAAGKGREAIAEILRVGPEGIKSHRLNIGKKLGINSVADITRIWMQLGATDVQEFNEGSGI